MKATVTGTRLIVPFHPTQAFPFRGLNLFPYMYTSVVTQSIEQNAIDRSIIIALVSLREHELLVETYLSLHEVTAGGFRS